MITTLVQRLDSDMLVKYFAWICGDTAAGEEVYDEPEEEWSCE